jgi:hypothetical protein
MIGVAGFAILSAIFHPASAAVQKVIPEEDSGMFNCQTMGNRICGPANDQGATPGIYARDGRLIATWDDWLANLNRIDHDWKAKH